MAAATAKTPFLLPWPANDLHADWQAFVGMAHRDHRRGIAQQVKPFGVAPCIEIVNGFSFDLSNCAHHDEMPGLQPVDIAGSDTLAFAPRIRARSVSRANPGIESKLSPPRFWLMPPTTPETASGSGCRSCLASFKHRVDQTCRRPSRKTSARARGLPPDLRDEKGSTWKSGARQSVCAIFLLRRGFPG